MVRVRARWFTSNSARVVVVTLNGGHMMILRDILNEIEYK